MPRFNHSLHVRKGLMAVKSYVKANKSVIHSPDEWGQTLLHIVAFEGNLEIMIWLLKHVKSSDLKKRDKNGWTPLHAAASQGNLDMYELLLKKGASPNAQNEYLTSPFAYLCRYVIISPEYLL